MNAALLRAERWLLAVFVFCIPFQTRLILFQTSLRFNEWTSGFLWVTDILFAILLILRLARKRSMPKISREHICLLFFLIIALGSVVVAHGPLVSWYRFIKLFEYVGWFWFLATAGEVISFRLLMQSIVVSGLVQSAVGLAQYLKQGSLGLRLMGESPLDLYGPGVAVVLVQGHKFLRAYGTMPHPNVLAAFLMVALWAAVWWFLHEQKRGVKLLVFGIYCIMLFVFLLTFSRIAIAVWLAASLALILVCALKKTAKPLVGIIVASIAIGGVFVISFWPQVEARLQISADDEAVSQRIFYMRVASESSRHHSLAGIGIGQFVPMLMKKIPHYPPGIYQPAHTIYLLILNELGIVGLAAFLFCIALAFKQYQKDRLILTTIVLSMLSLGLVDHFYWTLQQGGFLLWGILASGILYVSYEH